MPKFYYVARNSSGEKITGNEDAPNQEELIIRLQAKNLLVIDVLSETNSKKIKTLEKHEGVNVARKGMHGGVNESDLVLFCRQMATLLGAGVTILKALEIMQKQVSSKKFYNVLRVMVKEMEAGISFHEAMHKHPKIFSDLWVNLVESGEASGNLAIVLNRLATYLERNVAFKSKIISALMYPMILTVAGLGAVIFLSVKIIPTFAEIFKSFKMKLPALTEILLLFSGFIRTYFLLIIGIIVLLIFAFKKFTSTKKGRIIVETFMYKLPLFGNFYNALTVERFSSEMSTLVESGVPILYALEIAEHSVGSVIMEGMIRQIKEDVRNGKPLSQQLEKTGFFEPMVVQMVAVGEEIGELSQMFKKINDFYQDFVETFLTRITALFEPLMLLFMGGIIGIMVVGMFLPIFQLTKMGGG